MTQKRAAILQVLRESEGHLPADEIFARVKEKCPGIVLATVYNNLHALGILEQVREAFSQAGLDLACLEDMEKMLSDVRQSADITAMQEKPANKTTTKKNEEVSHNEKTDDKP